MITDDYVFFWSGPFSQWKKCTIKIEDIVYNCAEQYMMAMKAKLFKDEESYDLIMASTDPAYQKLCGRHVKNFNQELWAAKCQLIVYRANLAKFTQSVDLKMALFDTGKRKLVEASSEDHIWGIGMAENDPNLMDTKRWGLNLLGECITMVREDIRTLGLFDNE
jgi:ribA/ribD-fused uncharacterized protein